MTQQPLAGLTRLDIGIILLTIGTALTHIVLGLNPDLQLFLLNGLGYLGLLALIYAPISMLDPYRNWVRWGLIGYTVLTIVLWVIFGARNAIGFINKLNEVALVAVLVVQMRQGQQTS